MGAQEKAEAKIQKVLRKMSADEVDRAVPDDDVEFKAIAEAVMAWYQLLMASGIVDRKDERVIDVLASSMLILGTLVKYAYALGLRRGERRRARARKRR
jgi:hypothetical protein